jgi:hypothetical protein
VVFSRGGGPSTRKRSIQQLEVGNAIHVYPSPIREPPTTGPADLISKEPRTAFLNSVIMGFENPLPVAVTKPYYAPVLNGCPEQLIHLRFGSLQGSRLFLSYHSPTKEIGVAVARFYASHPAGASNRNRKKWRPQRVHRQGKRSQWRACSRAFRAPTLLKSIDLQCGQCGENMA